MKEVKGIESTLIVMSTEKCIGLLNHVVHLKLILHRLLIMLEHKEKHTYGSRRHLNRNLKLFWPKQPFS